jgi:hypothetical protein
MYSTYHQKGFSTSSRVQTAPWYFTRVYVPKGAVKPSREPSQETSISKGAEHVSHHHTRYRSKGNPTRSKLAPRAWVSRVPARANHAAICAQKKLPKGEGYPFRYWEVLDSPAAGGARVLECVSSEARSAGGDYRPRVGARPF